MLKIIFFDRPYSPLDTTSCPPSSSSSPGNTGSLHVTPTLLESQISKLAAAAERLSKHLPQFEPKPHNAKKKMCKELEVSTLGFNFHNSYTKRHLIINCCNQYLGY